ncbi:AMP-binding protein, partial [Massilia sp. Root335]|uniref:AMP-binding protein n=1 Tax=Massilia sp. Root335 TaxID=1736517 RepID=UPI0012F695F8
MSKSVNSSANSSGQRSMRRHEQTLSGDGWRKIVDYCERQAIPAARFLNVLCGFLLARHVGHRAPFAMMTAAGPLPIDCTDNGPAGDIGTVLRREAAPAMDAGDANARFHAHVGADGARLELEHAEKGLDGDGLLRHMERVGHQIVSGTTRWEHVSLLDGAEARRQLVEWNDTATTYPAHLGVHQAFEAQAARTPTATALAWDGGTLAYAELNARANRLARRLRDNGAAPDTQVALCLDRGPDLIVALL